MSPLPAKYVYLGFAVVFLTLFLNGLHIEVRPEGWLVEYKAGNLGGILAALGAIITGILASMNHD